MPQDVKELGRRVKAKYPGKYDDLADDDLGRRVKHKYPGAYDDFTDTVAAEPPGLLENIGIGAKRFGAKAAQTALSVSEAAQGLARGDVRPIREAIELAARGGLRTLSAVNPGAALASTYLESKAGPLEVPLQRRETRQFTESPYSEGFQQMRGALQSADVRAALDPSLAGKITRGGTELALTALPAVATGIATGGSLPAIATVSALQSAGQPETALPATVIGTVPLPIGQAVKAGLGAVRRTLGRGAAQVIEAEAAPIIRPALPPLSKAPVAGETMPAPAPATSLQSVFSKLETDNIEQIGAMIANANRRFKKSATAAERKSSFEDYNRLNQLTPDDQRTLSQVLPARSFEPVVEGYAGRGPYSRNISDIPVGEPTAQLDANLRELEAFFGGQVTAPRIAPETAIPAPPTPVATSQYGLGLQGMGQAMGDALRKTLRDSVARTGRLPRAESNSSIGRAYEAAVAGGAPRDVTTLDAVLLSLEGGGAGPQIAGRMASMARTPTSPVSLPQLRAEFPGMSKQQFDDEVLKLAEQGQVAIHRHDAPGLLSEAERNAMVKVGGDYYTAATVRGPAVGAPFDALNVAVSNAAESIPRSFAQKAKDELLGLFGVPKALRSTADISYPLRQGALLLLRPFQWRQAGKVWKEMFRGFRTKNFDAIKEAIETHPLAGRMDDAGLYRGTKATGEEAFGQRAGSKVSEMVRKTPIIKQSEQAYTAAADTQRVGAFEQYARLIDKAGLSPEEALKADKAAAQWINIATGRGSLGKRLDKAMEGLNFFFFSPRYVASRLNVFNPAMYIRNASSPGGRVVLKQQMSDLMQFASVVATTMYLAKQAGADVGLNPNSPDFLKIRAGNWRYDPLAGLQQVMRLVYRVGADIGRSGRGEKPKPGQTATDIGGTFLNYKLSPPAGVFRDFINQRTLDKKPFTAGRAIADLTAPMQWADFVEAYQKEAWGGVLKTLPGAAGVGVQNYAQTPVDAAIERSRPLFSELQRLNKRVSELHKKEGEKDDAFNIRVQQFSQNYTRFGQQLLNNPRFQSAPDALKAIALDRLNERAKHITNREFAFPEIELDANIIMDAAEQSKKNPANK